MNIECNDKQINLGKYGRIETKLNIDGISAIEKFYPFVGDRVQTRIGKAVIHPNTYTRRTIIKQHVSDKNES